MRTYLKSIQYVFLILLLSCSVIFTPLSVQADSVTADKGYSSFFSNFFDFLIGGTISGTNQGAQVIPQNLQTIPMRNLTIDTQNKSLYKTGLDDSQDGKMLEYSSGLKIKDWKIKYEKKGHNREVCEPPVLNISFDKTDSKGKPKELFTGISTYLNYDKLQYQKIRMIPECDTWNDYFESGDVGLNGHLNVNLREYIIQKIFRAFGVPVADVIGFANVSFITTDPRYTGKTFRYMILQRPQEKDDQIPFTTQFNLKPDLYESGDGAAWSIMDWYSNLLTKVTLHNFRTDTTVSVDFDPETTLRFALLTNFLDVGDMGFLHNEDGGTDIVTGKVKKIPHGFDLAFICRNTDSSSHLNVDEQVNTLSADIQPSYQAAYYRIARDIFLNPTSLNRMLTYVDIFPYPDVDKALLKEYITVKFYQYAQYFNSKDFAKNMGQTYQPLPVTLSYASENEYKVALNAFINKCARVEVPLTGVSVNVVSSSVYKDENSDKYGDKKMQARLVVDVKTTNSALQMFKNGRAFRGYLIGAKETQQSYDTSLSFTISSESGIEDALGPYYIIPPNTTARLNLFATVYPERLLKDTYSINLESFKPNGNISAYSINYIATSTISGTLEPISVVSPAASENISLGSPYTIKWTGTLNRQVYIELRDSEWHQYFINQGQSIMSQDNSLAWTIGKVYVYDQDKGNYKMIDLPEGRYTLAVRYSDASVRGESEVFNIVDSKKPKFISITYPTSHDSLEIGKGYTITWNSHGISSVNIDLMDHNGKYVMSHIAKNYVNDGSYWWNISDDLDSDLGVDLTRDDLYRLRISDAGTSKVSTKSSRFEITQSKEPTITVSNSSMKLKYDANNKESAMVMDADVVVTAHKDKDLIIPKESSFYTAALSADGNYVSSSQTTYTSTTAVRGSTYQIPRGKSAVFHVTSIFLGLQSLFPGSYKATIYGLGYGANYEDFKTTSENATNAVTIIGETSPYINTVNDPARIDEAVTISGVRFGSSPLQLTIYYGDSRNETKKIQVTPKKIGGQDVVSFIPKDLGLTAGFIGVQLTHPTEGASNYSSLELQ